jgi:hypothetical protein
MSRFCSAVRKLAFSMAAKRLQRLQTRAGKLRRALKATTAENRRAKRELKALAQQIGRGE